MFWDVLLVRSHKDGKIYADIWSNNLSRVWKEELSFCHIKKANTFHFNTVRQEAITITYTVTSVIKSFTGVAHCSFHHVWVFCLNLLRIYTFLLKDTAFMQVSPEMMEDKL